VTKTSVAYSIPEAARAASIGKAVETEALQQTTLIRILRTRLNQLIPVPLANVQEREARQRGEIERLLTLH
jgi:hypothetical protein